VFSVFRHVIPSASRAALMHANSCRRMRCNALYNV
jgi:hypothetical protein